jgi:hypothetical protein
MIYVRALSLNRKGRHVYNERRQVSDNLDCATKGSLFKLNSFLVNVGLLVVSFYFVEKMSIRCLVSLPFRKCGPSCV